MLDDIERELKRKLERLPLPELIAGARKSSHGETHHSAPRHSSGHSTSHKPAHKPAHGKPHPRPAAAPLPGGFDFSKPYEVKPATASTAAATGATHARHAGARAKRPTAALLGGVAKKS
jgi:hypothetical protein